ncbi:MAG: BlaI/MecI/CopY family transcriptional regulator [Opitutales bacterium]|nr:BlaI/MecI/CopY family transcriptional regulator [Opitutales bacterium]
MSNLYKTTGRELEILKVLWEQGPCSVRKVHEQIDKDGERGYTTTLKLMQIMHEKGLLHRDQSSRTHIYFPSKKEEQVEASIIEDLKNKLFAGSAEKLVMRALSSQTIDSSELERIREFIDNCEKQEMNKKE